MLFLPPNQQCQSTEGKALKATNCKIPGDVSGGRLTAKPGGGFTSSHKTSKPGGGFFSSHKTGGFGYNKVKLEVYKAFSLQYNMPTTNA